LSDLFALLIQIVGVVVLWAIVGELSSRGLTALAKRAGASKQLVRTIRDGVRIAWIVVAVAAVLIVTGIASEFQALTVTGLAGLTISWLFRPFFPTLLQAYSCCLTRPFD
jgi:hypothetical protein